ncbi:MAG: glutamate--tRNA ligase, partial [Planctomycetota bacterium]
KVLRDIADGRGVGFGKVAQPLRVAITGGDVSPGIHETVVRMGKDRVISRINAALEKFGDCH